MRNGLILLSLLAVFTLCAAPVHAACLTGGCHSTLGNQPYPHAPVMDDCLSCHAAVSENHPLPGQKTFKLVADGAELCFQCHDRFASKAVIHAPVADGDCLTCHQVHGASQPDLLEVGDDLSSICFGCHDTDSFRREFRHGPAAAGACTSCHDPHVSSEKALLKKPVRATCLECHVEFASQLQAAQFVHDPVKKSPCTDCHDAHAAASRYVLKEKMPDLCLSCHPRVETKMAKIKVRHAPMDDAGSCSNCHSSHFSQVRGLLPADEKTVCLNCHGTDNLGKPPLKNIRAQLLEKPTPPPQAGRAKRGGQEQKEKPSLHGPLQEGRCAGCHDPHGSDYFRILTGPYPADFYAPYKEGVYDFCLQCHDKYLLRFKETSLYTEFRNGSRNLHFVHVNDKRKGRSCRTCHEPHASSAQKLINEQGMPFGDWKIPIRFKPSATGGSCAPGCHQPFKYDRDTPIDYSNETQ